MIEKGDAVRPVGKLKKVIDFLAEADKETLRLLASFFDGEANGPSDAKRFKKPLLVKKVFERDQTVEIEVSKTFVWEEKIEYFEKVDGEDEVGVLVEVTPSGSPSAEKEFEADGL